MSYLPENYPASRETVSFQEALQPEVNLLWATRDDLLAQLDLWTATWGLDFWEDALGLSNGQGLDLDTRRRTVAAKLQGRATTTPEVVKDVAETLLGVPVAVIEVFDEYRVELELDAGEKPPAGLGMLKEQLRQIMPAHLDWGLVIPRFAALPITPRLGPRQGRAAPPVFRPGTVSAAVYVTPLLGVKSSRAALPMAAEHKGG